MSTPINLFIREFAVCLALKELFPLKLDHLAADEILQIKSIWRFLVKDRLSECLDKTYFNGNEVQSARESKNCILENDFLIVNIGFSHVKDNIECAILSELDPELFKRRRKGESRYKWDLFTRKVAEKVLQNTSYEKFQRYFSVPPHHQKKETVSAAMDVSICRQDPVMVAGRYVKLSRRLPQSPWIFDGVRKLESSVEELISARLLTAFGADSSGFLASGREDVDVRMLGTGRPFVVELRNCRNMVRDVIGRTAALEAEVNAACGAGLAVRQLSLISKESVGGIKQGETEKAKQYRMVVWCEQGVSKGDEHELAPVNAARDVLVQQLTPIRVLHRRALIDRPRVFHWFRAARLDRALSPEAIAEDPSLEDYRRFLQGDDAPPADQLFLLTLRCQAGSYVKEFVHGDLGRTRPNLATIIGQQCDILALDVLEIELDWPPGQ